MSVEGGGGARNSREVVRRLRGAWLELGVVWFERGGWESRARAGKRRRL